MLRRALCVILMAIAPSPSLDQAIAQATYAENQIPATGVAIEYNVSIPNPLTHLYQIEIDITGIRAESVDVAMPAWTPGVYFIGDYARNVQRFRAESDRERPLSSQQIDKQTWRIAKQASEDIRVRYEVFSNDLDDELADISTGTAMFMYVVGHKHVPVSVDFDTPSGWDVYTGLEERGGSFLASDYDVFADAPFLIGDFKVLEFESAAEVPHRVVFSNPRIGMTDLQVTADLQDLVDAAVAAFGPLPYKDYTFLVKVQSTAGGYLEHLNSTRIAVTETDFVNQTGYRRFLAAAAHSIVQVWNGKRIRPESPLKGEGPFDYSKENYSRLLWFLEGVSSYHADLLQVRTGILTTPEYFSQTSATIDGLQHQPGRQLMSLEDASWNTWMRSDNSVNNSISYPVKGKIVAMLLDLQIRGRTQNEKSLEDVVRYLMTNYGSRGLGLPEDGVLRAINAVAGIPMDEFYDLAVRSTQELPYDRYLQFAGLTMEASKQPATVYFGIETERVANDQARIRRVSPNSPAERGKLDTGDIVVSMDDERVTFDSLSSRVRSKRIGQRVAVTVLRGERMLTLEVVPMAFQEERWELLQMPNATPEQVALRDAWLGQ